MDNYRLIMQVSQPLYGPLSVYIFFTFIIYKLMQFSHHCSIIHPGPANTNSPWDSVKMGIYRLQIGYTVSLMSEPFWFTVLPEYDVPFTLHKKQWRFVTDPAVENTQF